MTNGSFKKIAGLAIFFLTLTCSPQGETLQTTPTHTVLPVSSPAVEPSLTPSPGILPTPVTPVPGPSDDIVPIFIKPFIGDYPIFNFFDHEFPFQFRDSNSYQFTWWGEKTSGINGHDGFDFSMPAGTQVLSAGDGVVVRSGIADPFYCPPLRRTVTDSLGIEIAHKVPDGTIYLSAYFHLSKSFVELNQTVNSGQLIGLSGSSGCSMMAHLHFMVDRFPGTNDGKRVHIDPFGWSGESQDPWANHKQGSKSVWLWKEGKAPFIFREETNQPSQTSSSGPKVKIRILRWMGWKDSENPNNEFVQLELSPTSADVDISGYSLKNLKGYSFTFPEGSMVRRGFPFRVYTGAGRNAGNILYMNQPGGIWDDVADCAILQARNSDTVHEVGYGGAICP